MFTGINSFVVFFGILSLISWSFYTVTVSQISNIEKAFGLSSSETGWMLTVWELGYMICTVFASYFGQRAHLPRVIGAVTIVCGLSGFIFALPHFVAFSESKVTENGSFNSTSRTDDSDVVLCNHYSESSDSLSNQHDSAPSPGHSVKSSGKTIAYVLFNLGMIIQGAAKAPCYPYSAQYVDDNVDKKKTGFYIGK
jgi:MFS family permease